MPRYHVQIEALIDCPDTYAPDVGERVERALRPHLPAVFTGATIAGVIVEASQRKPSAQLWERTRKIHFPGDGDFRAACDNWAARACLTDNLHLLTCKFCLRAADAAVALITYLGERRAYQIAGLARRVLVNDARWDAANPPPYEITLP